MAVNSVVQFLVQMTRDWQFHHDYTREMERYMEQRLKVSGPRMAALFVIEVPSTARFYLGQFLC